jgi:hypothetical protein
MLDQLLPGVALANIEKGLDAGNAGIFRRLFGEAPRLGVSDRIEVLVAVIGQTPWTPVVVSHRRKVERFKETAFVQNLYMVCDLFLTSGKDSCWIVTHKALARS